MKDDIAFTPITEATLTKEIGKTLARSVLAKKKTNERLLIPNFEMLSPGDIILSRSSKNNTKSPVVAGQLSLASKMFSPEDCSWTHAMVYVGNMHVAESQFVINIMKRQIVSGLQVVPISNYSFDYDLLICRHNNLDFVGKNVALYALGNCVVHKRKYPTIRIAVSTLLDRPFRKNLHIASTCSEFALECLAIGGTCLVKQYNDVNIGVAEFYPADLHASAEFKKMPMRYFEFVG